MLHHARVIARDKSVEEPLRRMNTRQVCK